MGGGGGGRDGRGVEMERGGGVGYGALRCSMGSTDAIEIGNVLC